jgi:DNA-binding MltR family transcriptional regulator
MTFEVLSEKTFSSNFLAKLRKGGDTGRALSAAALVDTALAEAIKLKMVKLSKDIEDRIFGGTGPLSNFSSKIDIAYSLRIIDSQMRNELHKVRVVRNKFAHTMGDFNFETPDIVKLCHKLHPIDSSLGSEFRYFASIVKVTQHVLKKKILPKFASSQKTSPGKSSSKPLHHNPSLGQKKKGG